MLKKILLAVAAVGIIRGVVKYAQKHKKPIVNEEFLPRIDATTHIVTPRDVYSYPAKSINEMRQYLIQKSYPFDEHTKFITNLTTDEVEPTYFIWQDFFEFKRAISINDPMYKMYMNAVYRLTGQNLRYNL